MNLFNSFCKCLFLWSSNDDDDNVADFSRLSFQRPEVCLDMTRSGKIVNEKLHLIKIDSLVIYKQVKMS